MAQHPRMAERLRGKQTPAELVAQYQRQKNTTIPRTAATQMFAGNSSTFDPSGCKNRGGPTRCILWLFNPPLVSEILGAVPSEVESVFDVVIQTFGGTAATSTFTVDLRLSMGAAFVTTADVAEGLRLAETATWVKVRGGAGAECMEPEWTLA